MKLKLLAYNTSPYPTPPPSTGCKNLEDFHSFLFGYQDFFGISRGSPYADIGDAR